MYYSFIIPAYNESERLATSLPKVFAYIRERQIQAEVIVVNDGSSDNTAEIARSFASRYPQTRLL
jgi:dolichyl-phosphate beta-glucosyltransferase